VRRAAFIVGLVPKRGWRAGAALRLLVAGLGGLEDGSPLLRRGVPSLPGLEHPPPPLLPARRHLVDLVKHVDEHPGGCLGIRRRRGATSGDDLPVLRFATAAAFEAWLGEHHDSAPGVWVKFAKEGRGIPSICFHDYHVLRYQPCGPKSTWGPRNKRLAQQLIDEGRMHKPVLHHGVRELTEAVLHDVLAGLLLEPLDLGDRVAVDHVFHSGAWSVDDTTYFGMLLMWSL